MSSMNVNQEEIPTRDSTVSSSTMLENTQKPLSRDYSVDSLKSVGQHADTLLKRMQHFVDNQQLHSSNCLGIALLAKQQSCTELLQVAEAYTCQHFMDVCQKQEFFQLNANQLGKAAVQR
ncbi:GH24604 [Drosophila grimshawi]|uniref:GH24604 n=1 Tax=Drosophila grimshawi TaxID=7222 RepID=B4JM99_DROGR|nr:GH24604 [Drosophila grimshawi]